MSVLEDLAALAARAEDEIGDLEKKRGEIDRQIHALRTVIRVAKEDNADGPRRKHSRQRTPFVVGFRAATEMIREWPDDEPLTKKALEGRDLSEKTARKTLTRLLDEGVIGKLPRDHRESQEYEVLDLSRLPVIMMELEAEQS